MLSLLYIIWKHKKYIDAASNFNGEIRIWDQIEPSIFNLLKVDIIFYSARGVLTSVKSFNDSMMQNCGPHANWAS